MEAINISATQVITNAKIIATIITMVIIIVKFLTEAKALKPEVRAWNTRLWSVIIGGLIGLLWYFISGVPSLWNILAVFGLVPIKGEHWLVLLFKGGFAGMTATFGYATMAGLLNKIKS